MEPVRVVVVDDSRFIQQAVQRMLEPAAGIEVVGVASDGREGVEQVRRLRPDVVVLDIQMPGLDGLEAIQEIMEVAPTPILVLSSHAIPGAEVTLKALELGAVDFISKTEAGTRMDIYDLAPVLRDKVLAVAQSRLPAEATPPPASEEEPDVVPAAAIPTPPPSAAPFDLLVIGASTGGPRAIAALLAELPGDFPAGILIAQHMPVGFTATLADRLDRRSALAVREARSGDVVQPGLALIGVGGRQLRVDRRREKLVVRLPSRSLGYVHRPSVDLLFRSAAEAAGPRAIGIVLTGMGQDGAEGLAAIREAGGMTLVESEESAVINGMPSAAAPWAGQVLPLHRIPAAVMRLFSAGAD